MSLTGRFSALFLAALGLVLIVFSTVLYFSARTYLARRVTDRLDASLAVLAAAAEVHAGGVEWEPQERILPLGQESGPDRLRWIVFDGRGQRIDHSRNLSERELSADWVPGHDGAKLPSRIVDRLGRSWQVAQRHLRAGVAGSSGSHAATRQEEPLHVDRPETLYPSLVLTVCVPLDAKESTLATLGWLLLTLSAGIWILAALLCRRLSRRALAPLTRMVESARGLNANDPGWCLERAGTGDELDDLGQAFNDLLARLHVAYHQQRRFSSDVSHQLRTPLTILLGQIDVALRHDRSHDEYRRVLKSALDKATALGQVVDALLFLGRADCDARLPDGEQLDLGCWVADYLVEKRAHTCAANIVHHRSNDEPLPVRVHAPLLGQMLDNLLDNACQYGKQGSSILVETIRERGMATLAVVDEGPGIPAEELARVFEPFYRSRAGRRRSARGIGLGLAIVHRIATAFGGNVFATSDVGRGSRFEVRLPLAAPDASLHGAPGHGKSSLDFG